MGCCSSSVAHAYLSQKPASGTPGAPSLVRQMSNIREYYSVVKTLGTGNYGCAYLVKDKRCGIERVAKEIIKSLADSNCLPKLELELGLIRDLVFYK